MGLTVPGNGVQRMFYNDPNVLYISIHVYRDGSFYPGGDEGNWDYCGEGLGLGKYVETNYNIMMI